MGSEFLALLSSGPTRCGVDYPADFEKPEDMGVFRPIGLLGSVLILNVLEHTFDPIRVLDNAATLLRPGGGDRGPHACRPGYGAALAGVIGVIVTLPARIVGQGWPR